MLEEQKSDGHFRQLKLKCILEISSTYVKFEFRMLCVC